MAVSYLSQTFKSSPYILPIDLGLMDKVLSVQQDKFNKGAAKTQALIDQMGALDVMKDTDREYLNSKISGIVDSINKTGGVNYSDSAVMSQIESMGSDVYGDDKVISAISSTKSVRNLMKTYQDYKTNPKLNKLYSEVNEAYDMRKVSQWLNDGQVGSSYHGPSSATPYTDYRTNHMKVFEKLKADLKMTLQDNGLFYSVERNEFIRPERVMAMAADLMTPAERSQMKRDAWYLYNVQSPTAPETLINKALGQYNKQINDSILLQQEYESAAKAAIGDNEARVRYNQLAIKQQQEVERLKAGIPTVQKSVIDAFKSDPEEFQYQIYSQDYFRGLGDRFSVSRVERDIKADQAEMFMLKYNQDSEQFAENVKLKNRELDIKQQDADTRAMAVGLKAFDPTTGKMKFIDPSSNLQSSNVNVEDPEGLRTSEKTILSSNDQLYLELGALSQNFINELGQRYRNLGIVDPQQTKSGTGIGLLLRGQQVLENVNGRPGFQIDDLEGLKNEDVRAKVLQKGMTQEGIEFLTKLSDNFKAMAEGRSTNPNDLPTGAEKFLKEAFMIKERIRANNEKISGVNREVGNMILNSPNLTNADKVYYQDYLFNPAKYESRRTSTVNLGMGVPGFSSEVVDLDPRIEAIQKKAGVNIDGEKEKLYKQIGARDVFRTRTFGKDDPLVKNESIQNYVVSEMKRLHDKAVSPSDVEPVTSGMKADGKGGFYIQAYVKDGDTKDVLNFDISSENARKIGLNNDPYQHLNYSVNLLGASGDIPIYGNKNLAITTNIVKVNPADLNNYSSFAQAKYFYLDENGNKIPDGRGGFKYELIDIPATEGMTPSEAFARAETAIKKAAENNVTFEQFRDYLLKYKP